MNETASAQANQQIKVLDNGPFLVSGGVPLSEKIMVSEGHRRKYRDGQVLEQGDSYALCRCGQSKNPPFCDGSHVAAAFDGSETADKAPFDSRAEVFAGQSLDLYDDGRCAFARFCHQEHGDVWNLTEHSNDPTLRDEAIAASVECPTGRLVHHDKANDNAEIELKLDAAISVLQDPEQSVSGPLFVQGGIELVGADGTAYERRNRYALCRCGRSHNKPFCDAMHVRVGYEDGL